jgi:N6-L-threonylcarbamoyladenine synthase
MGKVDAKQKDIRILGIETSCDETSVAFLTSKKGVIKLKKHFIATQIPIHARYGGVVPEVAARTHVAELVSLIDKTLQLKSKTESSKLKAGARTMYPGPCTNVEFDTIAVTQGPGLATALRVGIEAAKTLAWVYEKPLIPVNHLEGHLASAWLEPGNRKKWEFPILFLLVSGGHTELVLMTDFGKYKILSRTRDDAAGEAFDKTGKLMGLEYPGGPKLSKLASDGNPEAYNFPRPMLNDPSLNFSFSGLKTAVRVKMYERFFKNEKVKMTKKQLADMCASIQDAIVEVLVKKTVRATLESKPKAFAVVGGVSANKMLQDELKKALKKSCPEVLFLEPAKGLHTDNGAMIAAAGMWNIIANKKLPKWEKVDANPELDL